MRTYWLVALATGITALPQVAGADPISLAEALDRAEARPDVAVAAADLDATRGDGAQDHLPFYNPELAVAVGPRLVAGTVGVTVEASLGQVVELGGKRGARRAAAAAREDLALVRLGLTSRQARLEAWSAFHLALVGRARVDAAQALETLAVEVAAATTTRQGLGGGTQLEVNLAAAEVGRARHDRLDAETGVDHDRAALATAIGARADENLEPLGALPAFGDPPTSLDALIARARAERPELRTAVATVAAARADIDLADAVGRPDLRLGVSYALERDVETAHIAMVSAAITLPTRNRNQGARAAARARLRGAAIERGRIGDEVEREVRVAYAAYVRAVAAVHGFDQDVNEHLTENLQLARDSLASGKLDYFQFNQVRRELFASRMAYLDAVAEAIAAQVALDRAIGAEVLP